MKEPIDYHDMTDEDFEIFLKTATFDELKAAMFVHAHQNPFIHKCPPQETR